MKEIVNWERRLFYSSDMFCKIFSFKVEQLWEYGCLIKIMRPLINAFVIMCCPCSCFYIWWLIWKGNPCSLKLTKRLTHVCFIFQSDVKKPRSTKYLHTVVLQETGSTVTKTVQLTLKQSAVSGAAVRMNNRLETPSSQSPTPPGSPSVLKVSRSTAILPSLVKSTLTLTPLHYPPLWSQLWPWHKIFPHWQCNAMAF